MSEYEHQFLSLTAAQRQAVEWNEGPLLVLAGPGSGKTRVLTGRIARILRETPDQSFRVLALTFTNKAADEMQARLQALVDEGTERATVSTFHSFCMQVLQQHGAHLGLEPDFTIYSLEQDRREILRDGLLRKHGAANVSDASLVRYLQLIDKLKGALIGVDEAAGKFKDATEGANVAAAYRAYEDELKRINALDFNSLIQRAYSLVSTFDAIAARYRRTYKYWLIDEFQDTNNAQYKFLRVLAGTSFKNIFVVADDDQIIYQWNGANAQQLQRFQADFNSETIQLPTNWRCPPEIVQIANNLVRHNTRRSPSKLPLEAGKKADPTHSDAILIGEYATDQDEAIATAELVASRPESTRSETAVIARTKASLELVKRALQAKHVPVALAQRKDEFSSPEYAWMQSVLKQSIRKQDKLNFAHMIDYFNRWTLSSYSPDVISSIAEGSGRALFDEFVVSIGEDASPRMAEIAALLRSLSSDESSYSKFIAGCQKLFDIENSQPDSDLDEDARAWKALERSIISGFGKGLTLDQFLQHISLQSKEPPSPPNTVTLMTVHASKGKEFDFVHVIGLAEEVMPSYYSVKAGDDSSEMEEERRNCFVAITRTKRQLAITYAKRYRGYSKAPSRFLTEMGYSV